MADIYIRVFNNSLNDQSWEERIKPLGYKKLLNLTQSHRRGKKTLLKHLITPLLVPLNTRTWSSFSADFFLPTTTRHASKVKNEALKVIAMFFSIILDFVTFPFRLVSAVPTVIRDRILDWRTKKLLISFGAPENMFTNNKWDWEGIPAKHQTSLSG